MQIPFVGFQPIRTSEHMAAAGKTGLPLVFFNCCSFTLISDHLSRLKSINSDQESYDLRVIRLAPGIHDRWESVWKSLWINGACACLQVYLHCFRLTPFCSIWRIDWPGRSSRHCFFWAFLWQRGWFSWLSFTWLTQVSAKIQQLNKCLIWTVFWFSWPDFNQTMTTNVFFCLFFWDPKKSGLV